MGKKTTLALAITICVLGISVLVLHNRQARNQNVSPSGGTSITIAQAGDFYLYAPLYIAADKGFFSDNKLDVTIVSTGGDEKSWAAVISGSAQFGVSDPTFVAVAAQRGQSGKVIATIVNGVPFWGITKNPAIRPITTPAGLNHYSVATFPSPSTAYTLQRRMFADAGLPPNIREGAFGTLVSLLEAGQADIALELEPNVSQEVKNGYHVVYSLADLYGDFTITGLVTTPEYIEANRETTTRLVRSIDTALTFLHEHPDEAADLLSKRFPEIRKDVALDALHRVLTSGVIPVDSKIKQDAWLKAIKLRVDAGDLKQPADAMGFVDNSLGGK